MSQPDDTRLERELRDALDRRDPGPAPLALRERVLRVPSEAPSPMGTGRRVVSSILGLAAVITMAVLFAGVLGRWGAGPAGPPASHPAPVALATASVHATSGSATPASSASATPPVYPNPTPTPVAIPAPGPTVLPYAASQDGAGPKFDPYLIGPGIIARADDGTGVRVGVGLCVVLLAAFAINLRRRWRVVTLGLAGLLVAWAAVGSLAPVELGASGWGPGLMTVRSDQPFGYSENVIYEVAEPGRPFAVGLLDVGGSELLPTRLDAIEAPYAKQVPYYGITWTAVWLDREVNGGSSGPVEPFTSMDLPRDRSLWLVGRASFCAVGPSFDPAKAQAQTSGYTGLGDSVVFEVSVLGVPRRVGVPLRFTLVEPVGSCPSPPDGLAWPPTPPASAAP